MKLLEKNSRKIWIGMVCMISLMPLVAHGGIHFSGYIRDSGNTALRIYNSSVVNGTSAQVAPVPVPASLPLLASALLVAGGMGGRRK